jgi:hypothetical protein
VGTQDLDRYLAFEIGIPAAEDDAHAAAADLLVEAVAVGEDIAEGGCRHDVDVARRAIQADGFGFFCAHNFSRIIGWFAFRFSCQSERSAHTASLSS